MEAASQMLVRHPRLAKELTVKIIFVIDNKIAQMFISLVVVHSRNMILLHIATYFII